MAIVRDIFTSTELKGLNKTALDILQKYGRRLVDTSPEIRNIIKKDRKVKSKLKVLLRPKLKQLKRKKRK
jgi:hypothetical protein